MLSFLLKQGFEIKRVKGSHYVLQKSDTRTVIPIHNNDTLKIGTLLGILRDIQMDSKEFEELL
jgi:predicted RNA binding protein YcfA (HicA-like mRNA interferase family)